MDAEEIKNDDNQIEMMKTAFFNQPKSKTDSVLPVVTEYCANNSGDRRRSISETKCISKAATGSSNAVMIGSRRGVRSPMKVLNDHGFEH